MLVCGTAPMTCGTKVCDERRVDCGHCDECGHCSVKRQEEINQHLIVIAGLRRRIAKERAIKWLIDFRTEATRLARFSEALLVKIRHLEDDLKVVKAVGKPDEKSAKILDLIEKLQASRDRNKGMSHQLAARVIELGKLKKQIKEMGNERTTDSIQR